MSQIVQRAWRPTSTRPHRVAIQRRFKTFERRVDKNNDVYYTIAKRRPVQDPDATPESQQFFEMPNLLLDLDAEGTRNVRTYEDKDEELQKAKWRVNPKREEVKVKLNDLEGQLIELRKRAKDITASPANIWRLTSHDLLSAALHGQPENESTLSAEIPCLDTLEGSHLVNALRHENGIPSHVSASDVLLLEWMLLRRHNTGSAKSAKNEAPLNAMEMVEALQSQSSITGIRRLLLHNLRSWAALKASFGLPNRGDPAIDVAGALRRRCIELLGSEKAHGKQFLSCLALVGNLVDRVAKAELKPDHRLEGLALRTVAHSGSLVALSEWTHRICSRESWESGPEIAEDAAACMQAYTQALATQPETAANRQLLLQIVTGLDEHEKLAPESLRSIALTSTQGDGSSDIASPACDAYAMLLGELGAVRTLLKESESANKVLKESCTKVLKSTPKYIETLKTQGVTSLAIEECVSKDYHDIAD
ncbi:hypothetical protein NLG97_g5319 [Lecanicillium saksenae]|uniref:Uncharacterized protein n=1 Tax=Lecanicillium saksenae TaxID=468837 RepID=A0ACC1QTC1_9HYPO|nr:hypothetical protein NLG97_g5319 [Lecanicillium saksenae]